MRTVTLILLSLVACTGDPDSGEKVPPIATALGAADGSSNVEWTYILGEEERLTDPRDLGFDASGNLWIANREDDRTFIVSNPGTDSQDHERRKDAAANHFMEETAALSFDDNAQFGSCGETRNTYDDAASANDFMGPVLWSTDLDIFAEQNPDGLGSHLDMLHQSPNCVGIAWERENVYWVFDGKNDTIVRYDFSTDHGVGQDDHSNGIVHRLTDFEVARVEGAPGHMMIDPETGLLYVADTGNGRVLWIDTATGEAGGDLRARNEPLEEYAEWVDVDWGVLVDGLDEPGGLALEQDHVYIAEHGTGILHAFTKAGEPVMQLDTGRGGGAILGIEIGPDGALWVVDDAEPAVYRLDPR